MNFAEMKREFERTHVGGETTLLTFHGVDGYDVYNCSIPFEWQGKRYIFGRVERREEWARSWSRLFIMTGKDEYTLISNGMIYPLEDPFITMIGGEAVLGGTHVRMRGGEIDTVYGYFYRGRDLNDLYYFTTGPAGMKDIRLVQMPDSIGVFSRPRNDSVRKTHGSESVVGFTRISDLSELTDDVVENAPVIEGMFGNDEWGGCNQCYMLDSGLIGIIGHKSYTENSLSVYTNVSYVFNVDENRIIDERIIATRSSFPNAPAKQPKLADCAFTSGIVMRTDGKADLYSGLGDTSEGRVVIDYPFEGYGNIVGSLC